MLINWQRNWQILSPHQIIWKVSQLISVRKWDHIPNFCGQLTPHSLFLWASETTDSLLGDWFHSLSTEGLRLDLHNESARTSFLTLATRARIGSVFSVAFFGAHSDWFFAANWERTILDADANAGAKLTLLLGLFHCSSVAFFFESFETAVTVSRTSGTTRSVFYGLVLDQRTNRIFSAWLRQHQTIIVGTFAFLARVFRGGGVTICFRPSIRDGARNARSLIWAFREIYFFWFFDDWEIALVCIQL